jgi:hypothetical protein
MKRKISRKLEVKKTTLNNLGQQASLIKGGDFDTPTVNDRCDHGSAAFCPIKTYQYTYCVCAPVDWCGYHHETNCAGPLLTAAQ